jgi:hypothetical protein
LSSLYDPSWTLRFAFLLQVPSSRDLGVEDSIFQSSYPLVGSMEMASYFDMSELLAILDKYDEFENYSSCYSSSTPLAFSPPSWSSDCRVDVESGEVETLFCQCDKEDALVECPLCGSLFKLDTFYPQC